MLRRWLASSILLLAAPAFAGETSELLPPVQIQAGGRSGVPSRT
jgi:hypothetical protein